MIMSSNGSLTIVLEIPLKVTKDQLIDLSYSMKVQLEDTVFEPMMENWNVFCNSIHLEKVSSLFELLNLEITFSTTKPISFSKEEAIKVFYSVLVQREDSVLDVNLKNVILEFNTNQKKVIIPII